MSKESIVDIAIISTEIPKRMTYTVVLTAVLLFVARAYCRSSGAPLQACTTLAPNSSSSDGHGAGPQDSNSNPFMLANTSMFADGMGGYRYVPGEAYKCKL